MIYFIIFSLLIHWAEAWPLLIPLFIYIIYKPQESFLEIIAVYILVTFSVNMIAIVTSRFQNCMPVYIKNNNLLYNASSLFRLITFTIFFKKTTDIFPKIFYTIFLGIYLIAFTIYFFIYKNFGTLSSSMHSIESACLIFFCIRYFIKQIKSDELFTKFDPYLLIIAGLSIFESVNFFVFLFYQYLPDTNDAFAHNIWYVVDASFFVFCLFITRAFYGDLKKQNE